jgi:hypothetical protein
MRVSTEAWWLIATSLEKRDTLIETYGPTGNSETAALHEKDQVTVREALANARAARTVELERERSGGQRKRQWRARDRQGRDRYCCWAHRKVCIEPRGFGRIYVRSVTSIGQSISSRRPFA